MHDTFSFVVSDLILSGAAVAALGLFFSRCEPAVRRFASRTGWCMLLLGVLPVALRLALLRRCPVPVPNGADDFAYLLLADTLRHFRLANPMHPMRQFFEAVFLLQEPAYASIFPVGQGIVLALGWMFFGNPWAGVLLSSGALCALCYWMLRGWVSPGWALVGGSLAVATFGPLCQWTNLYWGGAPSAIAGCLVFGALPRLQPGSRWPHLLLGAGLGLQFLTRPFEFVLLALGILPFLAKSRRRLWLTAIALLPAAGLTLLQDHAVTGNWLTTPYQLSRYQYGIPTTFTFQANPSPHRELTAEQELDYRAQAIIHGDGPETPRAYAGRWVERLRFYPFFLPLPLLLALPAFPFAMRERRLRWMVAIVVIFSLGTNFYPYFYPHYIATLACIFLLIGVVSLQRLSRWKPAMIVLLALCGVQFLFWYTLHAAAPDSILNRAGRYEGWDFINHGDPEGRIAINRRLDHVPGKQLVFVRYGPHHGFHEWIHNAADIDRSRIVWAADMGLDVDEILLHYYPDRTPWVVEPDRDPPLLTPYPVPPAPSAAPAPAPPGKSELEKAPARLTFEDGPVHNPSGIQEVRKKR